MIITDFEMTKLCAEAMGIHEIGEYNPLHDDTQAMALEWWLIQCGTLRFSFSNRKMLWAKKEHGPDGVSHVGWRFRLPCDTPDLKRRAIVYCVATLYQEKPS